jgi:Ca-activated chloride channel family protein
MMMSNGAPHGDPQGGEPGPTNGPSVTVEALWERPVVAAAGGEALLLVRISAAEAPNLARRAPLDVAFVLDRSGSMHGGKLDLAREGVSVALTRLRDDDRAALVVYDDAVDTIQPLAAATPRMKASLRMALHGVDPGGSTFLSGGWLAGCRELAEAPALPILDGPSRIRRTILLTDGLANIGMLDAGELARHAGELRRHGIATTTVGVGLDFDEGLLSAMAEAGGGNFQYVADPEGLKAFFSRELEELFSVIASMFTVTLSLPPGVEAELVSAFPVESRPRELAVAVGDIAAGDTIDLVFALMLKPGAVGDVVPVRVGAHWVDPRFDEARYGAADPGALRRVESAEVEAARRDETVAEHVALQRAAARRRAGLDLDRAGRFAESRAHMHEASMLLQAAPQTMAVRFDLAESAHLAEAPGAVAYSQHDRKRAQHREGQRRRGRLEREASAVEL